MEHALAKTIQAEKPADSRSVVREPARESSGAAHLMLLRRFLGNRALGLFLQAKLKVSAPGDHYEQEADRVAEQVMRMPTPPSTGTRRASVQRQTPEEREGVQMKPLAATITPLVQRAPSDPQASFEPGSNFEAQLRASGGNSPLPASTRAFMEPRFGTDFSGVRLHTGGEAVKLNRAISAQAFTHGSDIYFGECNNNFESSGGKQLLAHELTHTIQQGAARTHGPAVHRAPAHFTDFSTRLLSTNLVQRKPDDIDALIRDDDWHRAAWTLSQRDATGIALRVSSMSSPHRRSLVEGARHGEGIWNTDAIVSAVYQASHRDAIIGSVRFFVWKHLWGKAGTYLCGLNNEDMRQVAIGLRLTIRDMQVMADEQTDKAQALRLNLVLLGSLEVVKQAPSDLIMGGEKLAEVWLLGDPLVGPFADKKFKTGKRITGHFHLVPADKWADTVVKHSAGRKNPETGQAQTDDEVRAQSWRVYGFYDRDQGDLYVRQGGNWSTVIHEAIHFIASDDFKSLYGFSVNEGATEYFARHVARHASMHQGQNYREEHDGVAALARLIGDVSLANAFFTGNGFAVQSAVDNAKGQGTFSKWVDAMEDGTQRKNAPDMLK